MTLDALAEELDQELLCAFNEAERLTLIRAALAQAERMGMERAAKELTLQVQSRESVEASFYRYLRDVAGQIDGDWDGPMICSGLGDNFDYLRGDECDQAIREAMDKAAAIRAGMEKIK